MQLTIDSEEPLDDVLRTVGSLFGVTLVRGKDAASAAAPAGGADTRSRRRGASGSRSRRSGGAGRPATTVDASPGDIRQWAAAHGFAVSARGALPKDVREAYRAANG